MEHDPGLTSPVREILALTQAAAARWLATSDLDAHVGRLRAAYRAHRDTLLEGLAAALPPGSTHNRPEGGMFVWARPPDGWDASALLPRRRGLERLESALTRP